MILILVVVYIAVYILRKQLLLIFLPFISNEAYAFEKIKWFLNVFLIIKKICPCQILSLVSNHVTFRI